MKVDSIAKIHGLAKFEKLTPLYVDYSPKGEIRVRRWRPQWGIANDKPNATAMDNIPQGAMVRVCGNNGIYEVRPA